MKRRFPCIIFITVRVVKTLYYVNILRLKYIISIFYGCIRYLDTQIYIIYCLLTNICRLFTLRLENGMTLVIISLLAVMEMYTKVVVGALRDRTHLSTTSYR